MSDFVILVDSMGNKMGTCEKMEAHKKGLLHLAFSLVVIKRTQRGFQHLLQRRAIDKYHSGGKWSNACCSHPRQNELLSHAVRRRAYEELGLKELSSLEYLGAFQYKEALDNELTEHEFDHVFLHIADDQSMEFSLNPDEVSHVEWVDEDELEQALFNSPDKFTAWFSALFKLVKSKRETCGVI